MLFYIKFDYISVWLVFSFDQSFHVCLFDLRYTHSLHQQLIFLDYFVKKLLFSFYVYLYFFYQPAKICSKVYNLYQSNLWQLNKYLMDVAQAYCKFQCLVNLQCIFLPRCKKRGKKEIKKRKTVRMNNVLLPLLYYKLLSLHKKINK